MANRFAYVVDAAVVRRVLRFFNLRTYSRGGLQSSLEDFARSNPDIEVRDLLAGVYHPAEVGMPELARPQVPLDETRGPNPYSRPRTPVLYSEIEEEEPPKKRRRTAAFMKAKRADDAVRNRNETFRRALAEAYDRDPSCPGGLAALLLPAPPRRMPVSLRPDMQEPRDLDRRPNPPVQFPIQRVSSSNSSDDELSKEIRKRRRVHRRFHQDRYAVLRDWERRRCDREFRRINEPTVHINTALAVAVTELFQIMDHVTPSRDVLLRTEFEALKRVTRFFNDNQAEADAGMSSAHGGFGGMPDLMADFSHPVSDARPSVPGMDLGVPGMGLGVGIPEEEEDGARGHVVQEHNDAAELWNDIGAQDEMEVEWNEDDGGDGSDGVNDGGDGGDGVNDGGDGGDDDDYDGGDIGNDEESVRQNRLLDAMFPVTFLSHASTQTTDSAVASLTLSSATTQVTVDDMGNQQGTQTQQIPVQNHSTQIDPAVASLTLSSATTQVTVDDMGNQQGTQTHQTPVQNHSTQITIADIGHHHASQTDQSVHTRCTSTQATVADIGHHRASQTERSVHIPHTSCSTTQVTVADMGHSHASQTSPTVSHSTSSQTGNATVGQPRQPRVKECYHCHQPLEYAVPADEALCCLCGRYRPQNVARGTPLPVDGNGLRVSFRSQATCTLYQHRQRREEGRLRKLPPYTGH